MDAFLAPSPMGALMVLGLVGGTALVRWRFKIDLATIVVAVMALWAISTGIAALVRFDGAYVQWAGMSLVLLGVAILAYRLPGQEH